MPTIFDYRSDKFEEAVDILNDAKAGNIPNVDNLILLKELFNNSLVGTTKLLHFINPVKFAIWDSRVYRYLTNKEPYSSRIGNCNVYMDYLVFCNYLTNQKEFSIYHKSIEKKIGYSMTAFRIVELVMYLNGEKNITKVNQRNANSV
jgi:hypothetical protein